MNNKKTVSLRVAYLALGSVIFLFTLGLGYFDTFKDSDIKWAEKISRILQKPSRPVLSVYDSVETTRSSRVRIFLLSMYESNTHRYLETTLRIVHDLKNIGVKTVLLECPSVSLTEKNKKLLIQFNETGIVVFGRSLKYDPRFDDIPYAEHPFYNIIPLSWGAYTLQFDVGKSITKQQYESRAIHKIFLSARQQNAIEDKLSISDVIFEVIKKYRGFDDTTIPEIKGTESKFGDYVFPILQDSSFLIKESYHGAFFLSPVFAQVGEIADSFSYRGNFFSKDYEHAISAIHPFEEELRDKIIILDLMQKDQDRIHFERAWGYAAAIESFITNVFVTRVRWWHIILSLLFIVGVAFLSRRLRPFRTLLVVGIAAIALIGTHVWLYDTFNVSLEVAYPLFSLILSVAVFPAVRLAYENKAAAEERRKLELELERKKLVETQKEQLEIEVAERTKELRKEKEETERLLYNILPVEVAKELQEKGMTTPRRYEEITILFTDFRGFTNTVATMPAGKLVEELNDIFQHFDDIIDSHGLEKIKTIGDSYMIAAGLPKESENHAIQCVKAALEMLRFMEKRNETSAMKWQMRAGIHSGTVVAGVVGKKKFTYDVWGDTVNIASRMETSGEPGKVNISAYTYDLVKRYFECEYRGKVDTKGKGEIDMYFVKGEIEKL